MSNPLTPISVGDIEPATDKIRVFKASDGTEYHVSVADLARILNPAIKSYPDASHTLVRDDAGRHLRFTNAGAVTVTIENDNVQSTLPDTLFTIEQAGAGTVTLAPGSGVSLRIHSAFSAATAGQYAIVQARKVGPNEWLLVGMLATA